MQLIRCPCCAKCQHTRPKRVEPPTWLHRLDLADGHPADAAAVPSHGETRTSASSWRPGRVRAASPCPWLPGVQYGSPSGLPCSRESSSFSPPIASAELRRGANRPDRIVVVHDGHPHDRHHRIADKFLDGAAVPPEHALHDVEVPPRDAPQRSSSRSPSAVESVTLVKKTVRPCAPRTRRRRSRGSRHSGHRTVPPSATRRHKAPF